MSFSACDFVSERRDKLRLIKLMVDTTERLHKHIQLGGSELSIPILNESRYLSRALVDLFDSLMLSDGAEVAINRAEDALARARLAASSAMHDVVDQFMAACAQAILAFEQELFRINPSSGDDSRKRVGSLIPYLDKDWKHRYRKFLLAYGSLESKIADSRAHRENRENCYAEIIENMVSSDDNSNDLAVVVDFYRDLPMLELFLFDSDKNSEEQNCSLEN